MGVHPKVDVKNLTKFYDGLPVLERVNLDIERGSFCTIIGASGCGKSTFLRMLLSQERPTRGTIRIDGKPLPDEPTPDRGIVFQRYSTFSHLTVLQNLIISEEFERSQAFGKLFGKARLEACARVEETLVKIGLEGASDKYPEQLSGGMQQRLAIGQALLKKPDILLLDEPFGALDPGIRLDMQGLLLDLWQDLSTTVFMVTHDISEAFKLGTRLLVFDKIRHDPQEPHAYGSTVTYDLPLSPHDKHNPPPVSELFQT